jgi:enamine deaminase RidA (YjgF/YER057c/UK114 family)
MQNYVPSNRATVVVAEILAPEAKVEIVAYAHITDKP